MGILRTRGNGASALQLASRDLDSAILLPIGTEPAVDAAPGGLTEIIVEFRRAEDVVASLPLVRRALEIAHRGAADYRIIAAQELLQRSEAVRRRLTLLLGALAASSILVGAVGIMSMMLVCVRERVREIGIRRAIGASGACIGRQFFIESLLITATGAALGSILGIAAHGVALWADVAVALDASSVLLPASVALLVGCVFGVHPAVTAARLDPVVALRQTP